jgi:hypothetical protein
MRELIQLRENWELHPARFPWQLWPASFQRRLPSPGKSTLEKMTGQVFLDHFFEH